jgi:hypothetical protein
LLARSQKLQGSALAIVGASATEAIGWFDPSHVRALTELLPLPQPGQLVRPLLDVQAESEPPVYQPGVGPAVSIRHWPVDQNRRLPVCSRRSKVSEVGESGCVLLGQRLDLLRGRDQLAAVVQHGEADIDVVGEHMWDSCVAQVLDHIVDEQPAFA